MEKRWKDWTEPLNLLVDKALEFVRSLDLSEFPRGGVLVEGLLLYKRKERLARAFAAFLQGKPLPDFKEGFVYAASIYEATLDLVCEYIGENEHQMGLHNAEEFAQNETDLLEDFRMFIEVWENPRL